MTTSADVKQIYEQLQSYEDSVLGFLVDPDVSPDFVTDLLATLTTNGMESVLLQQIPHNASFIGAGMQNLSDKVNAVNREVGIRSMTRLEYYEDAAQEREEEKYRNTLRKRKLLQYMLGNSDEQRG